MSVKEILKKLISIDSRFSISNKEIIEYIENLLQKFQCTKFKLDTELELYNLVVKIEGQRSDNPLVFVGHTDTVLQGENWLRNPHDPIEENNKIYGLGSSDMKAGLAVMINAALELNEKPLQDVFLIFDCDEEYEGKGGLDLIKNFTLNNARVVILEPTSEKIILGQKGCIDLEIETSGKSMHASSVSPEKNLLFNANYKAINICNSLMGYEKKIFSNMEPEYNFPTLSLSYICGGTGAANMVSDKCILRISRRMIPNENIDEVYKEMEEIILSQDPKAKIKKLFWGEAFKTEKHGNFVNEIKILADNFFPENKFDIKHGWTEASLFSKWGETVIFGPGLESMAHKENEYCPTENLEKFNQLISKLILS